MSGAAAVGLGWWFGFSANLDELPRVLGVAGGPMLGFVWTTMSSLVGAGHRVTQLKNSPALAPALLEELEFTIKAIGAATVASWVYLVWGPAHPYVQHSFLTALCGFAVLLIHMVWRVNRTLFALARAVTSPKANAVDRDPAQR